MCESLPSSSARAKTHEHVAAAAVADPALLAVEDPGAVGLLHGARLDVVGVAAGVRLGQREAGELAAARQVGQEARLLLVGAVAGAMPLRPIDWWTPMPIVSEPSTWPIASNTRA